MLFLIIFYKNVSFFIKDDFVNDVGMDFVIKSWC